MENKKEDTAPPGFPLSKAFLEFAFEREVDSYSAKMGTNPGDNYMSVMHALQVIFKGEKEANNYLLKCYPTHPSRREILDQSNVFEKELFVYEDMLRTFQQIIQDSGADNQMVNVSTAPFHGGNVAISPSPKWKDSEWANENFLIMADLRTSQFRMADRINGLDMEHALLVIKEMVKWHALAWAFKERNGWDRITDEHPKLKDQLWANDEAMDGFKSFFDQINGNALKMSEESLGKNHPAHTAFQKVLEGDYLTIMRKFYSPQGVTEEVYEDMLRVKPEDDPEYKKEPWLTLTHGDCWVNNFLFRYDPISGQPAKVIFVDLQMYREACPTVDIAYFFASSLRAPIRIAKRDELLLAYHDAFLVSCIELKVKPYPGFSLTSLKRRYRRSELFGLLVAIPVLNIVLKPAEDAIDLETSVSEDGKVEDTSQLFSKVIGTGDNSRFKEEFIATLLNMYETGVL